MASRGRKASVKIQPAEALVKSEQEVAVETSKPRWHNFVTSSVLRRRELKTGQFSTVDVSTIETNRLSEVLKDKQRELDDIKAQFDSFSSDKVESERYRSQYNQLSQEICSLKWYEMRQLRVLNIKNEVDYLKYLSARSRELGNAPSTETALTTPDQQAVDSGEPPQEEDDDDAVHSASFDWAEYEYDCPSPSSPGKAELKQVMPVEVTAESKLIDQTMLGSNLRPRPFSRAGHPLEVVPLGELVTHPFVHRHTGQRDTADSRLWLGVLARYAAADLTPQEKAVFLVFLAFPRTCLNIDHLNHCISAKTGYGSFQETDPSGAAVFPQDGFVPSRYFKYLAPNGAPPARTSEVG